MLNVRQIFSSPHRLQTDSLCEKQNSNIITGLRLACDKPEQYLEYLPKVLWAIRANYSEALKCSPAFAMYGREMSYPDHLESAKETEQYASRDQFLKMQIERMAKVSETIRANARGNDIVSKRHYDKSSNERNFQVGDHVLYFQSVLPRKGYSKLARRWIECIVVERSENNVNYRLQIKATGRVLKPWIHVNFLRPLNLSRDFLAQSEYEINQQKSTETQDVSDSNQPQADKLPQGWYEVKRVMSRRKKDGKWFYRILWADNSQTVEPQDNLSDYLVSEFLKQQAEKRRRRRRRHDN
jgi:hypothetical protein